MTLAFWSAALSSSTQAEVESMRGFLFCVPSCEHVKGVTTAVCDLIIYYFTFTWSYVLGVLWQKPAGVWGGNDWDPGSACLTKTWSRTRQPWWDDSSWLCLKQLKLLVRLCLCRFFVIFLSKLLKTILGMSEEGPCPALYPFFRTGSWLFCLLFSKQTPFRSTAKNTPHAHRREPKNSFISTPQTRKLISAGEQASVTFFFQVTLQSLGTTSPGSWITLRYSCPGTHTLEHPKKWLSILPPGAS